MPKPLRPWTRDDVLALPADGSRYELVDGELLVSPSPRGIHQRAVVALLRLVDPYVRQQAVGAVGIAPADLDLDGEQSMQPDLFVGAMFQGREPIEWAEFGVPILVAEILSPITATDDRLRRRRRYQRAGVSTYWVVDLDDRSVDVWSPEQSEPIVRSDALDWQPPGAAGKRIIDLPTYFREVWGRG